MSTTVLTCADLMLVVTKTVPSQFQPRFAAGARYRDVAWSGRLVGVTERPTQARTSAAGRESLGALLGGRRGAIDASLPPLAFVVGWLVADRSIGWGAIAAIAVGVLVAVERLARGKRVSAVVLSLAAVVLAAYIALQTGRAEDFFLLQLFSNLVSALVWTLSILLRWPLLGVVVGTLLGQKTRWRRDPALLRAYSLASWVWVFGQYTVRVIVFGLLWLSGEVVALGIARTVLTWPLVALTIAVSGWVLHRALPHDHPGLRHPREQGLATPD